MFLALIQNTGITYAEVRQAYTDWNLLRLIKNRLTVQLINNYTIYAMYLMYMSEISKLDSMKQDMSQK